MNANAELTTRYVTKSTPSSGKRIAAVLDECEAICKHDASDEQQLDYAASVFFTRLSEDAKR